MSRLRIRDAVGGPLMLRSTVGPFFEDLERLDAKRVIVDFSDVEFMSRSFADEYLSLKAASKKRVEETRVPAEAQHMLDVVSRQRASTRLDSLGARPSASRPAAISL